MNLIRFGTSSLILLALTIPLSSKGAPRHFTEKEINETLKHSEFQPTKGEKRVANNLAKVYEIVEKGYANVGLAKKVLKESRNYSVFRIYKDWLEAVIEVNSADAVADIKKICDGLAGKRELNRLKARLSQKSLTMCFRRYLKLLSKNASDKNLKREIPFFERHGKYIGHSSNIEALSFFLSRFNKQGRTWTGFSKAIEDHFLKADASPPKSLLRYLNITPRLTRHIQIKGLGDGSSSYVLYSELKKLIGKAFDAADEGADKKIVAKRLSEAVNYYTLSYEHLPQAKSDRRILSLGKSLARRAYFNSARSAFSSIEKLNPGDKDAVFEIMWTWIAQEKYGQALEVAQKHGLDRNYQNIQDDRLQFWTGYTLKMAGEDSHYRVFEDLISKSALNYYSILAAKFLAEKHQMPSQQVYFKIANGATKSSKEIPAFDVAAKRTIKRFRIWGALDFKPFINLERLNSAQIISGEDMSGEDRSAFILLTAAALKKEENYLESFKFVYKGLNKRLIGLDKSVLKILFPRPYLEEVSSNIKTFDPLIALSLMRQESAFNHRARSWVGARGLMQLMPATARMLWRGIKTRHLYDPEINIKIGSRYLSDLLIKYENNLVFALSAYNAGESRVKRWRKEYLAPDISILHNIENIPFPETRKYVKLIFRNLFFYKMLDKEVKVADSKEVNEIFDVKLGFNASKASRTPSKEQ